jgi:hypothetical protein
MAATGAASAEEALGQLLDTQQELDSWLLDNRDLINVKISRGIEQLARGEGIPGDVAKERIAAWLHQNSATKP